MKNLWMSRQISVWQRLSLVILWFTGTKLFQAKKFNDPDDPCKILVATDAIGMGLNLWAQSYIMNLCPVLCFSSSFLLFFCEIKIFASMSYFFNCHLKCDIKSEIFEMLCEALAWLYDSSCCSPGHIFMKKCYWFHHLDSHLSICLFVVRSLYRSIKRIIFNTLVKPNVNEKGEKQMETISTSQALQIAGRAGRSDSFSFSSVGLKSGEQMQH